MQSGNGIDLAAIYQLLTEVAQTVRANSGRFDRIEARLDRIEARLDGTDAWFDRNTEKLNELVGTVNEHTRKLDDLSSGLRELRRSVDQYHSAVVGHGIDLTRLGERVKRIEDHLQLGPIEA